MPCGLAQRFGERRPRIHDIAADASARDEAAGMQNPEMVGDVPRRPPEATCERRGVRRFAHAFEDLGAGAPDQLGDGRMSCHGSAKAWLGSSDIVPLRRSCRAMPRFSFVERRGNRHGFVT